MWRYSRGFVIVVDLHELTSLAHSRISQPHWFPAILLNAEHNTDAQVSLEPRGAQNNFQTKARNRIPRGLKESIECSWRFDDMKYFGSIVIRAPSHNLMHIAKMGIPNNPPLTRLGLDAVVLSG